MKNSVHDNGGFIGRVADYTTEDYYQTTTTGYSPYSFTSDSITFGVGSQLTRPTGLFFKPDGTVLFIVGRDTDKVYSYTLSTAWDLSTASYTGTSLSVSSQHQVPSGIHFKPDGTKLYISGEVPLNVVDNNISEYSLSTAWDISTASVNSVTGITSEERGVLGITFKPDGTKFYTVGWRNGDVHEYSMTTAWDISTKSFSGNEFSLNEQVGPPADIAFNSDGTIMYAVGESNQFGSWDLSTAYDVTTATFNSKFAIVSTTRGLFLKPDYSKLYLIDYNSDTVKQYSATTAPASILNHRYLKWSITEQKDEYTGGTTIQAKELYLKYTGSAVSWGSATITNPNGDNPANEGPANLIDGNINTKVVDRSIDINGSSVFIIDAGSGNTLQADSYYYVTGNDSEGRDPISWTIEGSNDGTNYTVLHTVTNATITSSRNTSTQEFSIATITNQNKKNSGVWSMDADYLNASLANTSLDIDAVYGTTYLRELTSFPQQFSSGSGGGGQIDVTWIFDMTFSTTDTGCILDQGGGADGTYVGMVSGGNLRLSASGAVSGVSNETSTTTTDMSAYAGVAGQLIVTIDYQNHIQCWWNDSTNGINQIVSVDYNGDGDWAGSNAAKVGQGATVHGGQSSSAFTGTITRYREITTYVDTSTF